jgi:RsiW-degrading membrane proteinase PrsW (M82 family)
MGPEIFLSAAAATLIAAGVCGYIFVRFVKPHDRIAVLRAALLAMPLPLVVVALIYLPQKWWLAPMLSPDLVTTMIPLTAPLVEEPAKWLVLFAPPVRRALRPDNAAAFALAVGFGFAAVEFWTQAASMIGVAAYRDQWLWICLTQPIAWLLGPFVHGGLVFFFASRLAQRRSLWPGALIGIGLHFALNAALTIQWVGPPLLRATLKALSAIVAASAYLILAIALARGFGANLRELMLGKRPD